MRMRCSRMLGAVLAVATALCAFSCRDSSEPTPAGSSGTKYGEKAFAVIAGVDSNDPGRWLLDGRVGIENSVMTTELPGAVFVVGVKDGFQIGDTRYEYRQIWVRNEENDLVLAKPGMVLMVPADKPVFGRTYETGTFRVPADSKFPE